MSDPDAARLRELQRRAFASGGSLTDAETAELRELTARGSASAGGPDRGARSAGMRTDDLPALGAAVPDATVSGASDAPASEAPVRSEAPTASEASEVSEASVASASDDAPSAASPRRRRAGVTIVAAAATLLLGFGIGWLVFARDAGVQMTAEQQEVWTELESSEQYDPGSVRLVGSRDELSVWQATDADQENRCIVLTVADQKEQNCIPASEDRSDWSLQVSLSTNGGDGSSVVAYWATILQDMNGEPVAAIQRHDLSENQYDWRDNFSGVEREIAEIIDGEGYDGEMLQIVGYDGDLPIWLHEGSTPCVIGADAEAIRLVACGEYSPDGMLEVQGDGVIYSVKQTDNRGPVLTVTRTGSMSSTPPGGSGGQIDDKTGEFE